MENLYKINHTATKKLVGLKQRLANLIENQGVQLDSSTSSDLHKEAQHR